MAKDTTPKGMGSKVRGPLQSGKIASVPLKERVSVDKMMKASLAERIKSAQD